MKIYINCRPLPFIRYWWGGLQLSIDYQLARFFFSIMFPPLVCDFPTLVHLKYDLMAQKHFPRQVMGTKLSLVVPFNFTLVEKIHVKYLRGPVLNGEVASSHINFPSTPHSAPTPNGTTNHLHMSSSDM